MAPAFGTPKFRIPLGAVHVLWEAASVAAHASWEAVLTNMCFGLGLIDRKASVQVCTLAPRAAAPTTIRMLLASEMSATSFVERRQR
jgi:hypothetical protein